MFRLTLAWSSAGGVIARGKDQAAVRANRSGRALISARTRWQSLTRISAVK